MVSCVIAAEFSIEADVHDDGMLCVFSASQLSLATEGSVYSWSPIKPFRPTLSCDICGSSETGNLIR
jgi:hypothetical protein